MPHTPEPWFYVVEPRLHAPASAPPHHLIKAEMCADDDTVQMLDICEVTAPFERNGMSEAEIAANARRIAACINFCAGISTEELERAALRRAAA